MRCADARLRRSAGRASAPRAPTAALHRRAPTRGGAAPRARRDTYDEEDDYEDDVMDALEAAEEQGEESQGLGKAPVADAPEATGSIQYSQSYQGAGSPPGGAGSPFLEPRFLATAAAVVAVPAVLFFGFQQWRKSQLSGARVRTSSCSALALALCAVCARRACNGRW